MLTSPATMASSPKSDPAPLHQLYQNDGCKGLTPRTCSSQFQNILLSLLAAFGFPCFYRDGPPALNAERSVPSSRHAIVVPVTALAHRLVVPRIIRISLVNVCPVPRWLLTSYAQQVTSRPPGPANTTMLTVVPQWRAEFFTRSLPLGEHVLSCSQGCRGPASFRGCVLRFSHT